MNNTESIEQDRRLSRKTSKAKRLGIITNDSSSMQHKMSNEYLPNRPKTTMNAEGAGKSINEQFAQGGGSADSRLNNGLPTGWNSNK